jgi:bilirubin oxidase
MTLKNHPERRQTLAVRGLLPLLLSAVALGFGTGSIAAHDMPIAGGSLDPKKIPKYETPLFVPPSMPTVSTAEGRDYYEIAVRQFHQRVLPASMNLETTLWGYGSPAHPETFHSPCPTIEAKADRPVRVKWSNELVDENGNYLPHLFEVDPTLHWAAPDGHHASNSGDNHGYHGPVPLVTHVHGAFTTEDSDGHPEAWTLPVAKDIDSSFSRVGPRRAEFQKLAETRQGLPWSDGSATLDYSNKQRAGTLWFHDHTLGITRLNVYAGILGFYLIRGGADDLPSETLPNPGLSVNNTTGKGRYDIPLAIQDRSFNEDGSLFYPESREFFDGFTGPFTGEDPNRPSDIPPVWNPEVFGNTMVVNGNTWPVFEVEARRYRFRLLNGCNARFLMLRIVEGDPTSETAETAVSFDQIGTEGGYLPSVAALERTLLAPAERADVIVDFSQFSPDSDLYLINEAPDEPFGGGEPGIDFHPANQSTTRQVMKFHVVKASGADTSTPASKLKLPAIQVLDKAEHFRTVSLFEADSKILNSNGDPLSDNEEAIGPSVGLLGTEEAGPLLYSDPVTERPTVGEVEQWKIYNHTEDAHPVHIHQVMFRVIGRQAEGSETLRAPEAWETGWKDTLIVYPGEVTTVALRFDLPGSFMWHCHILEHEDNEMMRPIVVESGPRIEPPVIQDGKMTLRWDKCPGYRLQCSASAEGPWMDVEMPGDVNCFTLPTNAKCMLYRMFKN